ncbi:DUF1883 domain-containing protein [Companilactobacillus crustorum]|uniref:DUF1883 domain-containing protein n=1 Tax=Companilactobacillus crustorum TaxID=392416 RepID=UPI00237ECEBD|nr:DUF1883 domain-containing protein [Companilactobacillus crustorum]WDT64736.1 DUF1883 domain-containing protein [Companilactobacillus crustorum]
MPYCDNPGGALTVTVQLQHSSNVYLVDETNLRRRNNGQQFEYHGGHYDRTPVTITISGSGRWYLIVDNGEQYKYQWSK